MSNPENPSVAPDPSEALRAAGLEPDEQGVWRSPEGDDMYDPSKISHEVVPAEPGDQAASTFDANKFRAETPEQPLDATDVVKEDVPKSGGDTPA